MSAFPAAGRSRGGRSLEGWCHVDVGLMGPEAPGMVQIHCYDLRPVVKWMKGECLIGPQG